MRSARFSNHRREALPEHSWLILAGSLSTGLHWFLLSQSRSYADIQLDTFLLISLACAALSFLMWWKYQAADRLLPFGLVLGFAVIFRVIGVFTFPILEDDFYRYLWDGFQTMEYGSPYVGAPADFFDVALPPAFETILDSINYPYVGTVYGPLCQWVFALVYWIAPGEVWPLQAILAASDIALIFILRHLLIRLRLNQNSLILYAWCPLVVKEFAITAHPDVIGIALLFAAYASYLRGGSITSGLLLGLAAAIKPFALLIAPFLLGFKIRAWFAMVLMMMLVALPWGIVAAWAPEGLRSMGGYWLFNAPLHYLFLPVLPSTVVKIGLGVLFLTFYASYYVKTFLSPPTEHIRGDWIFAAFFLCLPVLNAWYFLWLLPFAVLFPSLWAWVASVSILLAYATGINLPGSGLEAYQHAPATLALEFGLILLALLISLLWPSRPVQV